jgi:hypothetical protein
MPKTAGISFRATLEEHFGAALRQDYGDYPLAHPPTDRHRMALQSALAAAPADFEGVECVHGHFLPVKYLLLADRLPCRFVTWLREPVARLVSHYHYWLRAYEPNSPGVSALHQRVVEERWSLEAFCLAPELRNLYSAFLWGFPLETFDFVGVTEYFEEDLRYFSTRFLSTDSAPRRLNLRAQEVDGPAGEELSPAARRQVAAYHATDVALYKGVLHRRERRGLDA